MRRDTAEAIYNRLRELRDALRKKGGTGQLSLFVEDSK